jgi:enamine deaminase RidA (YjgF/YER057c/UK114 family)
MRPCTLRSVSAADSIKATSLAAARVEHAPWCRTAPAALPIHIKPLAPLMERRLISGHSPFEAEAGFSRAVVIGDTVHVAGTAPIPHDGSAPPESAYEQAHLCLSIIGAALGRAGASLDDVVRTRIFVTDAAHWGDVSRAHGDVFRDVRPAATCVVTGLLDPRWKVEIEAEAVSPQ